MDSIELKKQIKKALRGNRNAFDGIMKAYGQNVYGYIFSLLIDKQQVDDLFQETWIKVYRNLSKYDESKPFTAWLITIAKNTVYDHCKKAKVIQLPLHEQEHKLTVLQTPESAYLINEEMEEFVNLLESLSEKDKNLIVLKYVNAMSHEEIANYLHMEVKEVKWQLYEAKKRLRKNSDRREALV